MADRSQSPRVIDADSHFGEPVTWLVDVDPALADECPGTALFIGLQRFIGADDATLQAHPFWTALRGWSDRSSLAAAHELAIHLDTGRYFSTKPFCAESRAAWMDENGIDQQVLNPTVAVQMIAGADVIDRELGRRMRRAYNQWAADQVTSSDRFHPAGIVDVADNMTEIVDDLERMAHSGAVTFLVDIDDRQWARLADPAADPIWSAAVALGLQPAMHLGVAGSRERKWDASGYARWADQQIEAQRCLLRWVGSVHAAQRPGIRVVVQELGLDWAPSWLGNIDRSFATPVLRDLLRTESPARSLGEIARSQVVWVPLPRDAVTASQGVGTTLGLAFGSDYPHLEGWGDDPVEQFRKHIGRADAALSGATWLPSAN